MANTVTVTGGTGTNVSPYDSIPLTVAITTGQTNASAVTISRINTKCNAAGVQFGSTADWIGQTVATAAATGTISFPLSFFVPNNTTGSIAGIVTVEAVLTDATTLLSGTGAFTATVVPTPGANYSWTK